MAFVQEISPLTAHDRSGALVRILHGLSAFGRRVLGRGQCASCDEELLRLAELSPHLLADIGFRKDEHETNDARQVWRKGHIVLELPAPE
ncbi:hypothetical protein [Nioella sp.]|uniref:hypothetical protein n=1 Tax=Nioella sp. TaxID=1912091 RepID=UPI003B5179F5